MYPTVPLFTLGYASFLSRINTSFTTTHFVGCSCTLTYTVIFAARSCGSQQTEGNIFYAQLCSYQQQGRQYFLAVAVVCRNNRVIPLHPPVFSPTAQQTSLYSVCSCNSSPPQGNIFYTQLSPTTGQYFLHIAVVCSSNRGVFLNASVLSNNTANFAAQHMPL